MKTRKVFIPAVPILALLLVIALPSYFRARKTARRNECVNVLWAIESVKEELVLEYGTNKYPQGVVVSPEDIALYMRNYSTIKCPCGGKYSINAIGENATCTFPGHSAKLWAPHGATRLKADGAGDYHLVTPMPKSNAQAEVSGRSL